MGKTAGNSNKLLVMDDKISEGMFFSYEDYKHGCWMDAAKPTWLGYMWQAIQYYWWINIGYKIALYKCKKHGHDWDVTDTGGPESGPCIYADCLRCGKSEGPNYMN